MQQTETIAIDRPQSQVWPMVGNPASWPKWMTDVQDVVLEGPLEVGTKLSYKWKGRTINATVSRYIRGQVIGIRSNEKSYESEELISLRGIGSLTLVSLTMNYRPAAWWGSALSVLLWPAKKVTLGRPLRKELNALRSAVETPEPVRQRA